MRFLVDENLPGEVAALLRRAGHDVLFLLETGHRGMRDDEVWRLAVREERVIVTRDLDFPLPDSPKPAGVVLVRVPDTFTRTAIAEVMSEFVASTAFQRVAGTVTVVSPGRVRARSL